MCMSQCCQKQRCALQSGIGRQLELFFKPLWVEISLDHIISLPYQVYFYIMYLVLDDIYKVCCNVWVLPQESTQTIYRFDLVSQAPRQKVLICGRSSFILLLSSCGFITSLCNQSAYLLASLSFSNVLLLIY